MNRVITGVSAIKTMYALNGFFLFLALVSKVFPQNSWMSALTYKSIVGLPSYVIWLLLNRSILWVLYDKYGPVWQNMTANQLSSFSNIIIRKYRWVTTVYNLANTHYVQPSVIMLTKFWLCVIQMKPWWLLIYTTFYTYYVVCWGVQRRFDWTTKSTYLLC